MPTFTAIVHKEGDLYVARCPEAGTVSRGLGKEEAVANLREATKLHLEGLPAQRRKAALARWGRWVRWLVFASILFVVCPLAHMEFAPPPPDFVEGPFVLVVSLMLSGFSTVATVLYVVVTAILYRALRARPKTYTVSDIILFCVLALLLIYLATHVEYVPLQRNA